MQKLYVQQLRPGMVVARAIYNDRGDVLLARGVALSSRYISALESLGFYAIYVTNGIGDDLEPPEVLTEQLRAATYKHVRELFDVVQNVTSLRGKAGCREAMTGLSTATYPQMAQLYRDVEKIVDEVITAETLSGIVSLKSHDSYTFEHSVEVTVAGVMLGKRLYLPLQELHQLALGCLCHDIGKTAIPTEILSKPGRLTEEEFSVVKQHPQVGYEAVQQFLGSSDIIARHVVWQHHERQDGNGYPRGLKGNNRFDGALETRVGKSLILPSAEIAAVADVYSALASDRPYRRALTSPQIISTLREMSGTHLNRELIRRFLSILPSYPIGSEIEVISGKLKGHKGVVTEVNPIEVNRPKIRIMFDPEGHKLTPFQVDTTTEREIELATTSYSEVG
ncbi:MAG TPA: HD-GYP domain-containing protein [Chloroflexota bacterium]|nr:HD-GYP domain-containing protein [Chloroflexota bacterium]